jgi:hypothetical protein
VGPRTGLEVSNKKKLLPWKVIETRFLGCSAHSLVKNSGVTALTVGIHLLYKRKLLELFVQNLEIRVQVKDKRFAAFTLMHTFIIVLQCKNK